MVAAVRLVVVVVMVARFPLRSAHRWWRLVLVLVAGGAEGAAVNGTTAGAGEGAGSHGR
jgi:lipoprotein signal peptidase